MLFESMDLEPSQAMYEFKTISRCCFPRIYSIIYAFIVSKSMMEDSSPCSPSTQFSHNPKYKHSNGEVIIDRLWLGFPLNE